jgi:hypothetical protein
MSQRLNEFSYSVQPAPRTHSSQYTFDSFAKTSAANDICLLNPPDTLLSARPVLSQKSVLKPGLTP